MLDFYEFAKNFKEYLYSLGCASLSTNGNTNYFYGKDYEEYFWVHFKYESVWYRKFNQSAWDRFDNITPKDELFLKQLAVKVIKDVKQNNIKKAVEEIEKDFQ